MDDEDGERVERDSYYAALNVPRDASEDDIRRSYRLLAQACHPDKVADPAAREQAAASFMRIQEAYEVLSSEERRTIYDVYGREGLEAGMEVGEHLRDPSELKAEFERFRAKQAEQRQEASVAHRGMYIFRVDACDTMSPYDPDVDHMPELTSVATTNSVQIPVSDSLAASLGCQVAVRRKVGGGSFICGVKRILTPADTLELHGAVGLKTFGQAELSRRLSQHTTAGITAGWQPAAGPSLSVSCSRQLSAAAEADWLWQVGPAGMMGLGFTRRGERCLCSARLEVGASTGVVGKLVWQASATLSLRASAKFGTMGAELELGGSHRLTEFSSAGCAVVAGVQGVLLKPRFSRGGHVFEVPVLLTQQPRDFHLLAAAYLAPPLLGYVAKYWVVLPLRRRARVRKALQQRSQRAQELSAAAAAATGAAAALAPIAARRLRKEAEKGGLVVVAAKYGTPEAVRQAEAAERAGGEAGAGAAAQAAASPPRERQQRPGEEQDAEAEEASIEAAAEAAAPAMPPAWLDVTLPVRFLVADSSLQFHKGLPKSGLLGFCDVAPGEDKVLSLSFLWQRRPHSLTLSDRAGAQLPRDGHALPVDSPQARHVLAAAEALQQPDSS